MATILAVGIATLDIVHSVATYPEEDREVRAVEQRCTRGGNATNTLVALSQQGHHCHWAGVLPRERDGQIVVQDLEKYRIGMDAVHRPPHGKLPTSYITLSLENGSRTILHYRDCPEYAFEQFDRIGLNGLDWVHFEGRNVPHLSAMLAKVKNAGIPCSLEVEKPREAIEALFPIADVLLFSRAYVRSRGYASGEAFLMDSSLGNKQFVAWGEQGAWGRNSGGELAYRAAPPVQVVDSIGAGDVFNAGIVHAMLNEWSLPKALKYAVTLASDKCTRQGLVLGA